MNSTKIRKEVVAYAKYPILETKARLTREECIVRGRLMSSEEKDWSKYIEDYDYFVAVADSKLYVTD